MADDPEGTGEGRSSAEIAHLLQTERHERIEGIHRKDDDYDRAQSDLGLSSLHRVDASLRVFQMAADFLSWLETVLAPSPPSDSN
jgi:hypothetical protein